MLAAAARKVGHTVIPLDLPQQHDKGNKTRRFTFDDITRDLRQLTVVFQLLGVLAEKQIDLIHANSLAAGLIGGVAAKLYGVPIVMHKRYATTYGVLDRICEALLDRVILVSEATRWQFAPHSKQVLIYNGVELSPFRPPLSPPRWRGGKTLRADLNLDPDAILSRHCDTHHTRERHSCLNRGNCQTQSIALCSAACCGRTLLSQRCGIYRLSEGTGGEVRESRIVLSSPAFWKIQGAILSLLDVVLLASTIPEACPRTIIEAMAAGVPVIATPLGGSKELVTPETGILVPPEDADAFAEAITQLAEDAEGRKRMGEACRLRAEQLFCATQNARLTEDLYLDLL